MHTPIKSLSKNILRFLHPVDILIILFGFFLSCITLLFVSHIGTLALLVGINSVVSIGIFFISRLAHTSSSNTWRVIHDWYPAFLIYFVFKEVYVIMHSLQLQDFDQTLIEIDRWLFGIDPTVWLAQFSHPILTELLQIGYTSFYFIMIGLALELYLRNEREKFLYTVFAIIYGFFLSYIGYLLVPAVGPRFTLHDFHALNYELPGLFATELLRDLINAGESIPKGALNAYELAQRDVFPSGHTQMTLIVAYLAFRYKVKSRYALYLFGTLNIIGTVYLRYHYVIDLIAGAAFMVFTLWTAPTIVRLWERIKIRVSCL